MCAAIEACSEKRSFFEKLEITLNVLSHIFIGFNTIFLSWFCIKSGLNNTPLHAFLCTLGYQFLMAEAILCLHSSNSWTFIYSRKTKTTIHWILQVLGCTLGIVGVAVKIPYRTYHFQSIHSITGLIATVLLCLGLITGLSAIYAKKLNKFYKPTLNKAIHYFLGLASFVIGLVSFYYGFSTGFIRRNLDPSLADTMKIFTVATIILVSIGPLKSLFQQVKNTYNS